MAKAARASAKTSWDLFAVSFELSAKHKPRDFKMKRKDVELFYDANNMNEKNGCRGPTFNGKRPRCERSERP